MIASINDTSCDEFMDLVKGCSLCNDLMNQAKIGVMRAELNDTEFLMTFLMVYVFLLYCVKIIL